MENRAQHAAALIRARLPQPPGCSDSRRDFRGPMARNRTFNEISIGDTATIHRVCTANDLVIFAHASGNLNPLSLPHDQDRDGHTDPDTIAPSMWVGSQISAILGNSLPGAG